jgi:abortive infection bacteriophage resistance protein
MGIYSDGKIYGISFRLDVVVYEQTYENPITLEQIKEAKDFYDSMHLVEIKPLKVSVYMKCSSTYNLGQNSFMSWVPSVLDQLKVL